MGFCKMRADDRRRYAFTKFSAPTDAESITGARRNYYVLIGIITFLFCITVGYFSYKIFIARTYQNDGNPAESPSNETANRPKYSPLYNAKPFLARLGRKTRKDQRELTCEEPRGQLGAIPTVLIRQIVEKNFENIHDYVNLDLLLHYEDVINENGATSLKDIFNEYQLKLSLVRSAEDFLDFLGVLKSNKFKFYANNLKGKNLELSHFESFFALTYELHHWYNYLNRLHVFLSTYDQQKGGSYFMNCTEENFREFTDGTQKLFFSVLYPFNVTEKKLQEINEIINEWAKPVKIVFDVYSVVFYNKVLVLSSINREIRGLNISRLKYAYFFASYAIYLDEDVELLGVDLAIIAPNWMFLKKVKINLNGLKGRNMDGDGSSPGRPGKPGNPGGNAGDFLGVGNPHEKFLLISADGGKGGKGQNGAKGQDGASDTLPGPPVDKPACMTKINAFKNAFGQLITHYKIYSPAGCGGSGMDGGVGGQGGAGGEITLIGKNSVKVKTGSKGSAGLPGKGGAGGVGGRDGCFYEVLDVDDEILHRVTRIKCAIGNVLPSGESGKDNHNTQGQLFPPAKERLNVHKCLLQFIQFAGGDVDSGVISLLEQMNQLGVYNEPDVRDFVLEYKLLEVLDKIEFYDLFSEQIDKYMQHKSAQPALSYLKSIVLGRMTLLKESVNYFFIDFKNYLNIIKRDIKATNEGTRELQSSNYLKRKIEIKRELISQNLKHMRSRLTAMNVSSYSNCVMIWTVDVLQRQMNQTSGAKHLELNDLFRLCLKNFNPDTESSRKILTQTPLGNEVKKLLGILENLTNKEDVGGLLVKLTDALYIVKNSGVLSEEEKNSLEALTDEVEHFMALYYFTDWEELENLFLKSLCDFSLNKSSGSVGGQEVDFLKGRLINVLTGLPYRLAKDAARQNWYPSSITNTGFQFFQNESHIEDVLIGVNLLEDSVNWGTDSLCKNHFKAIFDQNSTVGEFYYWPNSEISNKLRTLFSGAEIHLKSNLINRHIFEKNFVQFTYLKLAFECSRNRNVCQKELNGILDNFKIEITHSGYSYYNWNGKTRIVVSDKVSLEYSFRMRNDKQPEIYNTLYKKCQDGEIKLSPFTTWYVRLLPLNDEAHFDKLSSFADVVNLRLIGSGTYSS